MEAYEQAKEELGGLASLGDDMGALTGYLRRKLLRTCCCCCESGRRAREQHLANINLLTDERGFSINLPLASDLGLITAVKQVARRVYWEEIPRHEMTHAKFSRMMLEAWAEMAKSGKKTTTLFCLCVLNGPKWRIVFHFVFHEILFKLGHTVQLEGDKDSRQIYRNKEIITVRVLDRAHLYFCISAQSPTM